MTQKANYMPEIQQNASIARNTRISTAINRQAGCRVNAVHRYRSRQ